MLWNSTFEPSLQKYIQFPYKACLQAYYVPKYSNYLNCCYKKRHVLISPFLLSEFCNTRYCRI